MKSLVQVSLFFLVLFSVQLHAGIKTKPSCGESLGRIAIADRLQNLSPEQRAKLTPDLQTELIKKDAKLENGIVYVLFGKSRTYPNGIPEARFKAGVKSLRTILSVANSPGQRPAFNSFKGVTLGVVVATGSAEAIIAATSVDDVTAISWSPTPLFGH